FTCCCQSMLARRYRSMQMESNFGWFTAAFTVGKLQGQLLSGLVLGNTSLTQTALDGSDLAGIVNLALWVGAIASIIAVPVLYTLGTTPSVNTQTQDIVAVEPQTNAKPSALNILKNPGLASHMLAALALLAILAILVAFMPLVGETVGVSPLVIGALLAVRGATSVISRIFIRPL